MFKLTRLLLLLPFASVAQGNTTVIRIYSPVPKAITLYRAKSIYQNQLDTLHLKPPFTDYKVNDPLPFFIYIEIIGQKGSFQLGASSSQIDFYLNSADVELSQAPNNPQTRAALYYDSTIGGPLLTKAQYLSDTIRSLKRIGDTAAAKQFEVADSLNNLLWAREDSLFICQNNQALQSAGILWMSWFRSTPERRYLLFQKLDEGVLGTAFVYKELKYRYLVENKQTDQLPLPNFILKDEKGFPFRIGRSARPFTLLHYWGSWCLPCLKEQPALIALYRKNKARLEVIAIGREQERFMPAYLKIKDSLPRAWRHLVYLDGKEPQPNLLRFFHIVAYPTNILIDNRKKTIIYYGFGAQQIEDLDKFLR